MTVDRSGIGGYYLPDIRVYWMTIYSGFELLGIRQRFLTES